MGMARITNGGPERARKRTLGEREGRSCKHRIMLDVVYFIRVIQRLSRGREQVKGREATLLRGSLRGTAPPPAASRKGMALLPRAASKAATALPLPPPDSKATRLRANSHQGMHASFLISTNKSRAISFVFNFSVAQLDPQPLSDAVRKQKRI